MEILRLRESWKSFLLHSGLLVSRHALRNTSSKAMHPFLQLSFSLLRSHSLEERRRGAELDRGVGERWDLMERTSCKSLGQTLSLCLFHSLLHTHTHTHTLTRRQPVSGEASVEAGYVGGMCVITELHKLKTNDNVD